MSRANHAQPEVATEIRSLMTPTNLILFSILVYLVYRQLQRKPLIPPPKPIEPMPRRDYTPAQLAKYDGNNPDRHILVAVLGKVYDVTAGAAFYGPRGPYSTFGGRDASRALAVGSFDREVFVDVDGPIDDLADLDDEQRQALHDWVSHFDNKYIDAGKLVPNGTTITTSSCKSD